MEGLPTGYWVHFKEFTVSLLKAWYGEARPENEFRFQWLPRIDDDYSHGADLNKMAQGEVEGYFRLRAEPRSGNHQRQARPQGTAQSEMACCRRLVRDGNGHILARRPHRPAALEIVKTEVFFIPAATSPEKEGSLTNTQRLLQWHDKALDPAGRLPLRPVVRVQPGQETQRTV